MRTAGKSVLTAGITVAIGMLGLLVLRQSLITGVAVAAAATVAMTVLASLTLLPALLGFSGTKLARPPRLKLPRMGAPSTRTGYADPAAQSAAENGLRSIQRHPVSRRPCLPRRHPAPRRPVLSMKLSMPDESAQAQGLNGIRQLRRRWRKGSGPGSTRR